MLKGFELHFRKFWYIDGWVIVTYPMPPTCKIGCILENLAKKSTQFAPNWVLFAEKWYRDGSQNHAFRGIEMVEILNSTLSIIPRTNFLKTPPPGGCELGLNLHFPYFYSFWPQDRPTTNILGL